MAVAPLPPGPPYDPFDPGFLRFLGERVVSDVVDRYFRVQILGVEKLPADGPVILAPNHSGNAMPHDGMMLDYALWRRDGFDPARKYRSVFAPALTAVGWMRLYWINDWWRRCGGVDMTYRNFDRLLAAGKRVIYYPEGIPGIGKGFNRRYRLQPFHSSFVSLAGKYDAPFHVVSVVNAEWINPISLTFKPLDRFSERFLRIPFLPVPIVLLAFLFPFIFYLAFPSRIVFVIQDAVDVRRLLREEGVDQCDRLNPEVCRRVAHRIQQQAQRQLNEAVEMHGRKPYDVKGLVRELRSIRGRILRATPLGWPYSFVRADRELQRPPARNRLHSWLRDADLIAFYLPFGWFLIPLLRLLRKPPYGYRGLSRAERLQRQGAYLWSLIRRPLPSTEEHPAYVEGGSRP